MSIFSYHALSDSNSPRNSLTYPNTLFYYMKAITPTDCVLFPMDSSEYSEYTPPSRKVFLLKNFHPETLRQQRRVGDDTLPFKLSKLFQLEELTQNIYIGRSLAAYVC